MGSACDLGKDGFLAFGEEFVHGCFVAVGFCSDSIRVCRCLGVRYMMVAVSGVAPSPAQMVRQV